MVMAIGVTRLEEVVRPFVRSFPSPAAPLPLNYTRPEVDGVIGVTLGGAGGRTLQWTNSAGVIVKDDDNKFRESGRQSTKVRVENPDDSDQFVEFCRADRITLSPERNAKKPPRTSSYDPSGGYHDFGSGTGKTSDMEYNYKYPDDTTCQPTKPPKRGC